MQELKRQMQAQADFSNSLAARLSALEAQIPMANIVQTPQKVPLDVPAESDLFSETGMELVRTEEELEVARWEVLQSMIKDEQEAHAQLRQTFDTLPLLASQAFAPLGSDAEKSPGSSLTASTACLDAAGRGAADAFKTLVTQLREEFYEQLQSMRGSLEKTADANMSEAMASLQLNLQNKTQEAISALHLKLQNERLTMPTTVSQCARVEQSVARCARETLQLAQSPQVPAPACLQADPSLGVNVTTQEGRIRIQGPRSQSPVSRLRFVSTASSARLSPTPAPLHPPSFASDESTPDHGGSLSVRSPGNPGDRATTVRTVKAPFSECGLGTERSMPHPSQAPLRTTRMTLPAGQPGNYYTGDYRRIQYHAFPLVPQRQ